MVGRYPSFEEFFKNFDRYAGGEGEYKARYLFYAAIIDFFREYAFLQSDFGGDRTSAENYAVYVKLKEDERFREIADRFEDDYRYIVSEMEGFDDGEPVWREIIVDDEASIEKDSIGISWSWDRGGAVSHCAERGGVSAIYKAVRNRCDDAVNWFITILLNIMTRTEETEIRLWKGHTVEVVEILVERWEKDVGVKHVNVLKEPFIARL